MQGCKGRRQDSENNHVDECLYKWFLQKCKVPVCVNNFESSSISNFSARMRHLKLLKGVFEGGRFDIGYATLTLKVNLYLVTVQQPNQFPAST
jgi:hypothetical protein